MEHLTGFAPLAARYDGFILDLWGVIHDGVNAFPHAVETLGQLQRAGKRTLLLSNVPRPNDAVQSMMRRMGIADTLYTHILTSGEAVRRSLTSPPDLWWAKLGTRMFHIGPERDKPVYEGLPLTVVPTPDEADFVLNTGPDDHRNPSDMAEFEPVLQECAKHRLKMICGNPDLEVIRGGVRVLCAGALALRYQELGGDVRSLGKPDAAIYQPALQQLGLPPDRVLAVGDSLRTDIAGAGGVGIAACWVLDGIHGAGLRGPDGRFDTARAEAHAREANLHPVATLPHFAW
ncbi:MAG: HAD family hydrolase [Rhodospirillales bacterium 69-11]|nr:TIGR01459 family HAD-type hydrolase [Rhodospirillales bacterium]OJW21860.1 MAG: HAD family hydrolase [Rhodospirillales bacterium 69-11]